MPGVSTTKPQEGGRFQNLRLFVVSPHLGKKSEQKDRPCSIRRYFGGHICIESMSLGFEPPHATGMDLVIKK